jgi:hypothetical protein
MNSIYFFVLTGAVLAVLGSCAKSSDAPQKKPKKDAAEDVETGKTETTDRLPGEPSVARSCDDQWLAFTSYFTAGKVVNYDSSASAFGQNIPIIHQETVLTVTPDKVGKKVTLSSTNTVVSQLISQFKIPDPVNITKDSYISNCKSNKDSALPSLIIGAGTAKVTETKVESTSIKGKSVEAQYSRITAVIPGGTPINADIKVWTSLKTPGLVLKQVSNLTGVSTVGAATISEEISALD